MKKLMLLFMALIMLGTTVRAEDDKPIKFAELPQQSQKFIKQHFADLSIALVKMDDGFFDKSYEVIFTNGDRIDFDKKGEWEEIYCKYTQVPPLIIPTQINNYVSNNYPNVKIIKIEKKSKQRHEVELSNGIELTFDSKFKLIDIDN